MTTRSTKKPNIYTHTDPDGPVDWCWRLENLSDRQLATLVPWLERRTNLLDPLLERARERDRYVERCRVLEERLNRIREVVR